MVVDESQWVSLHTAEGVTMCQFGPANYSTLVWGRETRQVSKLTMHVPGEQLADNVADLIPWVHQASVWSSHDELYWTGPLQKTSRTRGGVSITASDTAVWMARTRTPMSKRWEAVDPCVPAGELWDGLIRAHGLHVTPITRPDPFGHRFDFRAAADESMMDQAIGNLVGLGLKWAVTAGVPLLGPVGLDPVAELTENDFVDPGIELIRDGSSSYNDVLVRGGGNLARARAYMAGLNLQTIVDIGSMFGVGNVDRAASQYVGYYGSILDTLMVPEDSALHPDAPVSIHDLVPSARLMIEAFDVMRMVELTSMSCDVDRSGAQVSVTLDAVPTQPLAVKELEAAGASTANSAVPA